MKTTTDFKVGDTVMYVPNGLFFKCLDIKMLKRMKDSGNYVKVIEEEFMGWPVSGQGIPDGFQRCPDCGELVGAGLISRIKHWGDCGGKGVVEAVQKHYDLGKPITVEEIQSVISEQVNKNKQAS